MALDAPLFVVEANNGADHACGKDRSANSGPLLGGDACQAYQSTAARGGGVALRRYCQPVGVGAVDAGADILQTPSEEHRPAAGQRRIAVGQAPALRRAGGALVERPGADTAGGRLV